MAALGYCTKEKKACVGWVYKHFNDCVCNARDEASFGLGLLSLGFWAVAELLQIVTNFRTKSAHAISFLFLLNWLIGYSNPILHHHIISCLSTLYS